MYIKRKEKRKNSEPLICCLFMLFQCLVKFTLFFAIGRLSSITT